MKKGFLVLLIGAFAMLAIGKIGGQLMHVWDTQQAMYQQLQTSIADQQAKIAEMDADIASTRAKPTLSDHDRWLIAHLSKLRDRLAANLEKLEVQSENFFQPLLRAWLSNGFMFLVFALTAGMAMLGKSGRLTREEQQWRQGQPWEIPGLLIDHSARRSQIAPLGSASNFITGRIKPGKTDQLTVTRSRTLTAMGLAFLLAPQGGLLFDLYVLAQAWAANTPFASLPWDRLGNSLMVSLPFAIVGLYLLLYTGHGVRIDRRDQLIHLDDRTLPFRDVASLQLNQVLTTGQRTFQQQPDPAESSQRRDPVPA